MKNAISNKVIVELSKGMGTAPVLSQDKVQSVFANYRSAKCEWDTMRYNVCRTLVRAMSESGNEFSLNDLSVVSGVSIAGVRGYLEKLIRSRECKEKGTPFYIREGLDNLIVHKERRIIREKWVKIGEDGTPMWDCITAQERVVTFYWATRE